MDVKNELTYLERLDSSRFTAKERVTYSVIKLGTLYGNRELDWDKTPKGTELISIQSHEGYDGIDVSVKFGRYVDETFQVYDQNTLKWKSEYFKLETPGNDFLNPRYHEWKETIYRNGNRETFIREKFASHPDYDEILSWLALEDDMKIMFKEAEGEDWRLFAQARPSWNKGCRFRAVLGDEEPTTYVIVRTPANAFKKYPDEVFAILHCYEHQALLALKEVKEKNYGRFEILTLNKKCTTN